MKRLVLLLAKRLVLLLALLSAPVLADKKSCVEHGEKLYAERPSMVDRQEAFKHCRPLAEAGDGEAQYYFASVHMFRTISQPPASPLVEKWMKRSAQNGYGKAEFYMATVYRYGNAVTAPDVPGMMDMYEKAALHGVPVAPLELARIWRHGGFGLPVDEAKAAYWYEFAARKYGFDEAIEALVELYGETDPEKARYWKDLIGKGRCCK